MAWYRSSKFPLMMGSVLASIMIIAYFFPIDPLKSIDATLLKWQTLLMAIVSWFGLFAMLRLIVNDIRKRAPGRWQMRIYQLIVILLMLGSGFFEGKWEGGFVINWLYTNILGQGLTAIYALLTFFIISTIFRTFRAKSLETIVFLIGGFLILFKNAPWASVIWPGFVPLGAWVLDYPYAAVTKGFTIGVGIGVFGYAIRYLLGYEKAVIGAMEE